jgi:Na+-translocating ferredoxin:NAD+ oxidoreductase RnfC subunit
MREEIIKKVKNAGIVGAGGAGFPTHVKIDSNVDTVIVNGAECEPLLKVDQQLMDVKAQELIFALEIVMEATGAKEGIIALKGKYRKAISTLEKEITEKPIKLFKLNDFFPAGDEHVMVYEVIKKVIPEGGIPLNVGCVVTNVETLLNVTNAVNDNPVTDTYLTVTGDVPKAVTFKLPIGTTKLEAIELSGRKELDNYLVIEGGPMMGTIVSDLNEPITKTTKGLIVLPKEHSLIKKKTLSIQNIIKQAKSACIQCEYCSQLCPRNLLGHKLEPHKIMRSLNYLRDDDLKMTLLCSECGVCELYACPMGLSPRIINQKLKEELNKKKIKLEDPQKNLDVRNTREFRKIPVKRLINVLDLDKYNHDALLEETDYLPQVVRIPTSQHIGKPGEPVVNIGEEVKKGDLIAKIPEGALGANIHASIDGIIENISDYITIRLHRGGREQ